MLSPSSICTSALASGPRPMPPYSFGTNGHHRPCARALLAQRAQHFGERLGVEFLFRRDALVLHPFADLLADRLGFGRDFEIDRHGGFLGSCSCWSGLRDGINLRPASGNGKQSLKQQAVIPRSGIQYAAASLLTASGYGSSAFADDDECHARSCRSVSRICLRMDQHLVGPHLCPRRRQGAAAAAAARIFVDACDVAPRSRRNWRTSSR